MNPCHFPRRPGQAHGVDSSSHDEYVTADFLNLARCGLTALSANFTLVLTRLFKYVAISNSND